MPPVGFEPTISAGQRPQTYALERAATGNGTEVLQTLNIHPQMSLHHVANFVSNLPSRHKTMYICLAAYIYTSHHDGECLLKLGIFSRLRQLVSHEKNLHSQLPRNPTNHSL